MCQTLKIWVYMYRPTFSYCPKILEVPPPPPGGSWLLGVELSSCHHASVHIMHQSTSCISPHHSSVHIMHQSTSFISPHHSSVHIMHQSTSFISPHHSSVHIIHQSTSFISPHHAQDQSEMFLIIIKLAWIGFAEWPIMTIYLIKYRIEIVHCNDSE